jgi:hypothetical protein
MGSAVGAGGRMFEEYGGSSGQRIKEELEW